MILKSTCIFLALAAFGLQSAHALCFGNEDPEVESLLRDVGQNPVSALDKIDQAIAITPESDFRHYAWLVLARSAARGFSGQKDPDLMPFWRKVETQLDATDPLRIRMEIATLAIHADESDEVYAGMSEARDAVKQLPNGAARYCAAAALGYGLTRIGRSEEAFPVSASAYQATANQPGLEWPHAEAALMLGIIVKDQFDGPYTIDLTTEAFDYFSAHKMYDLASYALDTRAWSYFYLRDYKTAVDQFGLTIDYARLAENDYAIFLADSGLCRTYMELDELTLARTHCESAYRALGQGNGMNSLVAATQYARFLLKTGAAARALDILNRVIAVEPTPLASRDEATAHEVRGETLAALGRYEQAYDDIAKAKMLQDRASAQIRVKGAAISRARFQSEQLRHSLDMSRQEHQAAEARNRLVFLGSLLMLMLLNIIALILARHRRIFRSQAYLDALTNVPNRRFTELQLQTMSEQAIARRQPLTLAILDLDRFKSCNDRYGHDAGDEALKRFAEVARSVIRPGDLFGRWGGEEFLLAFPNTGMHMAGTIAERIRQAAAEVKLNGAPDYPLQFSAGAVELIDGTLEDALIAADKALYEAKENGRNRTCFARSAASDEDGGLAPALET